MGVLEDYRLERALGRLNALNFEPNDLLYCTKPPQGQVLLYTMRVSTAITSILTQDLGWRGNVRPIQDPQVLAPAYGWALRIQVRDFVNGNYLLPTFTPSLIGQLESSEMSQVKVWHARLRETTSIGTSNAYIYSALGIPGLASRGSCPSGEAQKDESGFSERGAHLLARSAYCQYGAYECRYPASAPFHEGRGFRGDSRGEPRPPQDTA